MCGIVYKTRCFHCGHTNYSLGQNIATKTAWFLPWGHGVIKTKCDPRCAACALGQKHYDARAIKIVSFLPQEYIIYLNSKYDTTHVRPITGSHGATDFLTNHRTAQPQGNRIVRAIAMLNIMNSKCGTPTTLPAPWAKTIRLKSCRFCHKNI